MDILPQMPDKMRVIFLRPRLLCTFAQSFAAFTPLFRADGRFCAANAFFSYVRRISMLE